MTGLPERHWKDFCIKNLLLFIFQASSGQIQPDCNFRFVTIGGPEEALVVLFLAVRAAHRLVRGRTNKQDYYIKITDYYYHLVDDSSLNDHFNGFYCRNKFNLLVGVVKPASQAVDEKSREEKRRNFETIHFFADSLNVVKWTIVHVSK